MGVFPMARSRDDPQIHWVDPEARGVLPLDGFHVSRSLRRRLLKEPFEVSLNRDFAGVVEGCAAREETWINRPIRLLYEELHHLGHAHSLELWEGDELVGGVYGVTLGRAFFGESMFSRRPDASKIALAYLVRQLAAAGYVLFDTQFLTPHLARLGAVEISRGDYHARLEAALAGAADLTAPQLPAAAVAAGVEQPSTQTS